MKNKSSFLFLFSTLFILSGVFLVQIKKVEAKDCNAIKKNIIDNCINIAQTKAGDEPVPNAEMVKCDDAGKKEYNQCIGSTAATSECDKQKVKDLEDCTKRKTEGGIEPTKAKAQCIVFVENNYKKCSGFIDGQFELPNDLDTLNQFQGLTLSEVIGNFMGMALKILGSIAFALMVGAGLTWMTAGGNSDRQRKALDTMVWAALGVVMILSSATIVKFVFDAFTN